MNKKHWNIDEIKSGTVQGIESESAWDEVEKSIVANIADKVSVRILGTNVEIGVYKTFQ